MTADGAVAAIQRDRQGFPDGSSFTAERNVRSTAGERSATPHVRRRTPARTSRESPVTGSEQRAAHSSTALQSPPAWAGGWKAVKRACNAGLSVLDSTPMKPRFRFFAAIIALSALVLFQAEGLWASSACSVEMEAGFTAEAGDADPHPADCPMGESGHSPEDDGNAPEPPACPLLPVGAASCVGGVAVLPAADEPAFGPADGGLLVASTDHAKDLLLAVSLLRPPQA